MSLADDQEAIIKMWVEFFESNSDSQFELEDVVVCLANVGLLQLQLEQKLLKIPTSASTSAGNPHLSQLDNILEEMYRNVGDNLKFENSRLALDNWDTSNTVPLTTQMTELTLEDKVATRKLQFLVNAVKLTVAGSLEASKKFRNSNFLYFVQMIDDTFVRCPWRTERENEPPPAFIYECPEVSNNLAYSLVDSCEIERSISTLLRLGDLMEKAVSKLGAVLQAEEDTTNQLAPLSDIWTTDSIMEHIFKCLPAKDCLRLRLVNQRFNHFAVQNLHRYHSDSIKLEFEYDEDTNGFFCPKLIHGIYHKLKLADLTNTMKPNSSFPCVNFSFDKGTIASPDIQKFLDAHGKQIKILHLHLYCEKEYYRHSESEALMPPVTQFLTLVTKQAPHLEVLSLDGFPQKWVHPWHKSQPYIIDFFPSFLSSSSESVVPFKNLKTFQLVSRSPKKFVSDFLEIVEGQNLKSIYAVGDIQPFIELDKFHLLKEFIWEINIGPPGPVYPAFVKFQELRLKEFDTLNEQFKSDSISNLTKLGIFLPMFDSHTIVPPSLNCLVSKIIEGSASTLQSFHLMGHMGIFHDLRFPVLPQVKELLLASLPQYASCHQFVRDPIVPFFPPGFCPAQIFPVLHKITIGFVSKGKIVLRWDECFKNCFKTNSPLLETVKCLEIQEFRDLPQGWMENLAVVCPCVEDINVKTILYNFPEDAVKGLWKFKKLKSLKLKINIWAVVNAFPAVDSVFTGFSTKTCLELFDNGGIDTNDFEIIGGVMEHASILDLKELTGLHVTFVDLSLQKKIWEHPIMTQVTGKYAFEMCPQLKVCIAAEGRTPELSLKLMQDLEPLYPYVHVHIPNNCPSEHFKHISGSTYGNVYNQVANLQSYEYTK